jgi:hypothetical protein
MKLELASFLKIDLQDKTVALFGVPLNMYIELNVFVLFFEQKILSVNFMLCHKFSLYF